MTTCTSYTEAQAAATTVHAETYRGVTFSITCAPAYANERGSGPESYTLHIQDRRHGDSRYRCPKAATVEGMAKKVRANIDTDVADAALLPQLTALVHNATAGTELAPIITPEVGDTAYVYAMGYYRRGQITAVKRTRVEVAYTTASSGGRVFRKAVAHGEVMLPPLRLA